MQGISTNDGRRKDLLPYVLQALTNRVSPEKWKTIREEANQGFGLVFEKRHSVSSIDEQLNASELQVLLLENGESISHNIVVAKHRARLGIYKTE
jgi:hypothetical protein